MNKELKISITDLYIGYGCAAFLMYAIGGIAYNIGKIKGKLEVSSNIQDIIKSTLTSKQAD